MARILEDAIKLEVKASLHVDEQTFNMCMGLIRIYAKEQGFQAMLVQFDDDYCEGYCRQMFEEKFMDMKECPVCGTDKERWGCYAFN